MKFITIKVHHSEYSMFFVVSVIYTGDFLSQIHIPYLRFLRILSELDSIAFCFDNNFTLHSPAHTHIYSYKWTADAEINLFKSNLIHFTVISNKEDIHLDVESFLYFAHQSIRHNWISPVGRCSQNWDPGTCWHPKNPIEVSPEFESNTRRWQRIGNFFNPPSVET